MSNLNIAALSLLCDNSIAAIKSVFAGTMQTGDQQSCDQVVLRVSATQQVVTAMAREGELPPDAQKGENCELDLVREVRAVKNRPPPKLHQEVRPKHYMMHLIGQSNMMYRGESFAEHCHRKIHWDN